ncbi:unnamed protein product [Darwinula stevensoni]|uniref:ascorbate ferrireductase (transmembrane) n=1 Tax=Darwinula stevensoni TaxID=69355 RepID=A0A7R8ZXN7_9CRUS|nr:unnamed protein product [Darwinula stevensoni]CAG0878851.1 unnamed protein product [Darwinula stevensoni]
MEYCVLMYLGVLIYQEHDLISVPHQKKLTYHWVIQSLSATSILLAYAAIYFNKERNDAAHLVTWHGTMGFVAVLALCVQVTGGACIKYGLVPSPQLWKKFHAVASEATTQNQVSVTAPVG